MVEENYINSFYGTNKRLWRCRIVRTTRFENVTNGMKVHTLNIEYLLYIYIDRVELIVTWHYIFMRKNI